MYILQLLEIVTEHLRSKVGVRRILISCVTRTDPIVLTIGTISATFPYYEGVDSFHKELIARTSHKHPNFADDNGIVLDVLVACLTTTRHMSDMKPFHRQRGGRVDLAVSEWRNMSNSKWDSIVSEAES